MRRRLRLNDATPWFTEEAETSARGKKALPAGRLYLRATGGEDLSKPEQGLAFVPETDRCCPL
ncbi:hypothetical protein [Infirmifilum sp. SLHALR2]